MNQNPTITVAARDLKPAITGLSKVIPGNPDSTTLGSVKFAANGTSNFITVTGAGSNVRLALDIPAGARSKCAFLVPFSDLKDTARNCGADDFLVLEPEGDHKITLTRESGGTRIPRTVNTLPASDYPTATRISERLFALDEHAREAIKNAQACASKDANRVILQGAYIDAGKTVVGTDGRHLFRSNGMDLPTPKSLVLPELKVLSWKGLECKGEWMMAANGKRWRISGDGWELSGEAVEGNYPNWRQVIPEEKDFNSSATFDAAALNGLAKTVLGLPGGKRDNKPVGIRVEDGRVTLIGRDDEGGPETEVPIPQGSSTGKPATVFLNRDYVSKALRFGLNKVDIKDELSPVRFRRSDSEGTDMIVMPVRVSTATSAPPTARTPAPAKKADPKPTTEPMKNNTTTNHSGGTNGHQPGDGDEENPLDAAAVQITCVKELLKQVSSGLTGLANSLKQAKADQRSTEKEVQAVRSTIRTLQKVAL